MSATAAVSTTFSAAPTSTSFYSSLKHHPGFPILSSRDSVLLFPYWESFISRYNSTSSSRLGYRYNGGPGTCCRRFRSRYPFPARHKTSSPIIMEWQDCTVKMEIDVPTSVAYTCYSDRQAIPQWMPFISSVKILDDKPELSRWSLKYKAFGRDIEFSWLARNMQPIPNQKIHWRALEGLPNRGAVRFYPKGASSCVVELTVSYEVPQLLVPVASALQPFLESLLVGGLEGFAKFAKEYSPPDATV